MVRLTNTLSWSDWPTHCHGLTDQHIVMIWLTNTLLWSDWPTNCHDLTDQPIVMTWLTSTLSWSNWPTRCHDLTDQPIVMIWLTNTLSWSNWPTRCHDLTDQRNHTVTMCLRTLTQTSRDRDQKDREKITSLQGQMLHRERHRPERQGVNHQFTGTDTTGLDPWTRLHAPCITGLTDGS